MKMRSQYVPEESRSTIINFFRIPLNMFVCVMLYNVSLPFFLDMLDTHAAYMLDAHVMTMFALAS